MLRLDLGLAYVGHCAADVSATAGGLKGSCGTSDAPGEPSPSWQVPVAGMMAKFEQLQPGGKHPVAHITGKADV